MFSTIETDDLIRTLLERWPILMGSARFRRGVGASQNAVRQFGVRNVLPQPFTRGEFVAAVREALED
jgi:hypothetical protein